MKFYTFTVELNKYIPCVDGYFVCSIHQPNYKNYMEKEMLIDNSEYTTKFIYNVADIVNNDELYHLFAKSYMDFCKTHYDYDYYSFSPDFTNTIKELFDKENK